MFALPSSLTNHTYILVPLLCIATLLVALYVYKTHARGASRGTRHITQGGSDQSKINRKGIRHITVLINPESGVGAAEKNFDSVQATLKEAGLNMTIMETKEKGHAYTIANQMSQQECDGIICVGGDGLVHEVVNGLLNRSDATIARHIPIGIIPSGHTNGLAHSLGIYTPQDGAARITAGRVRPLDILGLNPVSSTSPTPSTPSTHTLYSVYALNWGLSSEVEALADRLTWLRGYRKQAAALFTLLTSLKISNYEAKLSFLPAPPSVVTQPSCDCQQQHCQVCEQPMHTVKGKRAHTDLKGWVVIDGIMSNLCFFVAGNTSSALTPHAHLSDGYLDLAIVDRDCSRLDLGRMLVKDASEQGNVRYFKTSSFRLEVDRAVPLTIDGELWELQDSSEPFRLHVEVNRGLCLIIC